MSESIKFTEQELKKVNDLQGEYLNLQNSMGQLSISRIRLEQQLEEFDKAEDNIKQKFVETQTKEREFITTINKKYGDGNLDLNTGVFTPRATEETTDKTL